MYNHGYMHLMLWHITSISYYCLTCAVYEQIEVTLCSVIFHRIGQGRSIVCTQKKVKYSSCESYNPLGRVTIVISKQEVNATVLTASRAVLWRLWKGR